MPLFLKCPCLLHPATSRANNRVSLYAPDAGEGSKGPGVPHYRLVLGVHSTANPAPRFAERRTFIRSHMASLPETYMPGCLGDPVRDPKSPSGGDGGGPSPPSFTSAPSPGPLPVRDKRLLLRFILGDMESPEKARVAWIRVPLARGAPRASWLTPLFPPPPPVSSPPPQNLAKVDTSAVAEEAASHHDLLIFEGICDDMYRVGQKSVRFLQWLQEAEDAGLFTYDFAGLGDDDTFVRANAVLAELDNVPKERLYWGNMWTAANTKYWQFR